MARADDQLFDPIGQLRGPQTLVGRGRARIAREYRSATSSQRLLPAFLIVGAARAGSTSLFSYLTEHPSVGLPSHKEIHYFDLNFERGERWYRRHFPTTAASRRAQRRHGAPLITGEASPYYIFHPRAAQNIAAGLPEARCIVLLRNPVDRAYSHYQMACRAGRETRSFEEAIDREHEFVERETARLSENPAYRSLDHRHHAYVARGLYADQLLRWYEHVDQERTLVLLSEKFFADPGKTTADVHRFLGLSPHELASYRALNQRPYDGPAPETRAELQDYYVEPNARLADLLGRNPGWA
jgi:TPR repeat protein